MRTGRPWAETQARRVRAVRREYSRDIVEVQ